MIERSWQLSKPLGNVAEVSILERHTGRSKHGVVKFAYKILVKNFIERYQFGDLTLKKEYYSNES
jgi:hypothetical protein